MKLKVFLSGSLTTKPNWQYGIIHELGSEFVFFNPRKHLLPKPAEFTNWDLFFVKQCDILFAYMEEENPSGFGLSVELGYAKALGKTIILVDEKSSKDLEFERKFRIIRETADIVFDDLESGVRYLKSFTRIHN